MEIVVTHDEGRVPVTVFQLKGDLANEEPLRSQASEAYEAGTRNLILDLNDVPYITSSGLRVMHYVFDLLRSDSQMRATKPYVKESLLADTNRLI